MTLNYFLEWSVFVFGMMFLGFLNLLQLIKLKDKSFKNYFQIGFFFSAVLLYSAFKGAGVDVQPILVGVTVFLSIIFVLEAITLGEVRNEYKDQRTKIDSKGRKKYQPVPKELGAAIATFVLSLGACLIAILQITGVLEQIFLSL